VIDCESYAAKCDWGIWLCLFNQVEYADKKQHLTELLEIAH